MSRKFALLAVVSVVLAGCGGSSDTPGTRVGTGAAVDVEFSPVTVAAGGTAVLAVTLRSATIGVAGIQNDVHFAPPIQVHSCRVNPAIDKEASVFGYFPLGCRAEGLCERLRAIVLSFDNVAAIPDGSQLYECQVTVDADATSGRYPLAVSQLIAARSNGGPLGLNGSEVIVTVTAP